MPTLPRRHEDVNDLGDERSQVSVITRIAPRRWDGDAYEFLIDIDFDFGMEDAASLRVTADQLLDYERFQAAVMCETGRLYRCPHAEAGGRPAWLEVIEAVLVTPRRWCAFRVVAAPRGGQR